MSEENKNLKPAPVIRIDVSANRCHIGKTHMAALIAEAVSKQVLLPGSNNMLTVKSQDGDFNIVHAAVQEGRQFPPLQGLTIEIVDSNEQVRRGPPEGVERAGEWKTFDTVILSPEAVEEIAEPTFAQKIEKVVRGVCAEQDVNPETTDTIIGLILNDEKFQRLSQLSDFATKK